MSATACVRRAVLSSVSSSSKSLFRSASNQSLPTLGRVSRRTFTSNLSRLPVELGSAQSLLPFHSATATALLTSMLSMKPGVWGYLSEGFATTL